MIQAAIAVLLLAQSFAPRHVPDRPPHAVTTRIAAHAGVRGTASWYRWHPGEAAAGPALRRALGPRWRGTVVTVTANGHSVRVRLTDWCACPQRVIDIDVRAFARLAAPSRGLVKVTIGAVQ